MTDLEHLYDSIRMVLRKRREELNIPQWEVARRIGMGQGAFSDIETGKTRRTRIPTLVKWADALGYSVDVSFKEQKWKDMKDLRTVTRPRRSARTTDRSTS